MKNTQSKAVLICIMIMLIGILSVFWSMDIQFYAVTLVGVFAACASFVIMFLFISRANCMSKMLNGKELIASWVYSDADTIKNIDEAKEENKGLWFMAMVSLSLIAIIILITVGIAAEFFAFSILISLLIFVINVLVLKIFMHIDNGTKEKKETELLQKDKKKKYVYISQRGIYAHGQLHVWKGWGSNLREVHYNPESYKLSFTYSYLRPYGFGYYTVTVMVPQGENYLHQIKEQLLLNSSIDHNL